MVVGDILSGQRVKKLVRKQGGKFSSITYIDGVFERETDSRYGEAIPHLEIGIWQVEDPGPFINGYAVKDTLHIMDGQSRVATLEVGHRLGDTTPELKYILDDHLGNSTASVDDSGSLISKEEYYPFGETAFGSYGKKRYKFNGKERDEESGMYYYGMRYYNAWTGKWLGILTGCKYSSMN